MMFPIALGIIRVIPEFCERKKVLTYGTALMLAVSYSASIGGTSTPIGTPPNLIALAFLRDRGINISFFDWVKMALPISFCVLLFLIFYLRALLPKLTFDISLVSKKIEEERRGLGYLRRKREEILTLCGFGMAAILWILPGLLPYIGFKELGLKIQERLPEGVVALLAASFLFLTSSQEKESLKRIDWGTLLLFGGGLSLGHLAFETGLSDVLGKNLVKIFPIHGLGLVFFWAFTTSFLTEVTSNTAISAALIPISASVAGVLGEEFLPSVLAVTLASSYAFMLPVATPPNAIVYGSGLIPLSKMVRVGFWLNLAGVCIIWFFFLFFFFLKF